MSSDDSFLRRAVAVLTAFRADDDGLGAAELARRSGLPKSTAHRIALDLVEAGLLERQGARVRLGLRLFEIGQRVPRQRVLRDAAVPYMSDLREATRQTVHLAVLEGAEVVYVEILGSPGGPPLPSQVGGRLPAHVTGVGKAILAFSPPDVVRTVLDAGLVRATGRSLTAPGLLVRELERIRGEGVAYDREESGNGIVCAASPVLGPDGEALGALSVSGWSTGMRLAAVAPAVHTTALTLSRALGLPRTRR
ncbi:IclR family transcriptional regulator [Actinomadura sp. WMMB 499]|uniref:IclR family transcriptional regulator n=1 Tax=Actinomadura sp. WMMB 499 TaxID=1219491 RepID=UPI001243A59C|nr:IclR family transcriptional regulator [Actinomadura sp. WMMB 499]QFG20082.1 IclR family transcriptional regulator [Actinomadura sp. WMMB 499]